MTEKTNHYKHYPVQITKSADDDFKAEFVISTGDVDRSGDIVKPTGIDYEAYKQNPVVLWGHDSRMPPIGRAPKIGTHNKSRVKALVEFIPAGIYELADTVRQMVMLDFIRGASIGFKALEYEWRKNEAGDAVGLLFKTIELLEFSIVPVPDNPYALREAKAKGINTAPICQWAEDILDTSGDTLILKGLDMQTIEKVRAITDPKQASHYDMSGLVKRIDTLEKTIDDLLANYRQDMMDDADDCDCQTQEDKGATVTDIVADVLKRLAAEKAGKE